MPPECGVLLHLRGVLWRPPVVLIQRWCPLSYHRTLVTALHLDALTLVIRLPLLQICREAVQLAQRHCPPPLPAGPGGAPRLHGGDTPAVGASAHAVAIDANGDANPRRSRETK
jgi:hypothetical protein